MPGSKPTERAGMDVMRLDDKSRSNAREVLLNRPNFRGRSAQVGTILGLRPSSGEARPAFTHRQVGFSTPSTPAVRCPCPLDVTADKTFAW
jgi:hypothetical protein